MEKGWLAEDLQRALAATVVPDCSFAGCSTCGVCGPELGHNVVIPALPIPEPRPQRSPASDRVCRLRLGFAKTGTLALISHLDTLRLMERALRRTGLPVSYTGGFHPLPRLQLALPLPLGAEGLGEWMDLEFTETVDPVVVRQRLHAELPSTLRLLAISVVPSFGPSLSQELQAAHWTLTLQTSQVCPSVQQWQDAVAALLAAEVLVWHDTDKKGRPRQRDCRMDLQRLRLLGPRQALSAPDSPLPQATLALEASIDSSGRSLRPSQIAHWLGECLQQPLSLTRQCRTALVLRPTEKK